ncbi:MAG: hypothetical protein E2598_13040 [Sphingobium sp.]|nr:hypothetical protein [Sphingobium sp.]
MKQEKIRAGRLRFTRLVLRRRSGVEQRVVRMMRGDDNSETDIYIAQFSRLRGLAAKNGLVIQKPGAPYLSMDELSLLGWLAQSQRVLGYTRSFHSDMALTLNIVHCAGTLNAMGIHLPPPPPMEMMNQRHQDGLLEKSRPSYLNAMK